MDPRGFTQHSILYLNFFLVYPYNIFVNSDSVRTSPQLLSSDHLLGGYTLFGAIGDKHSWLMDIGKWSYLLLNTYLIDHRSAPRGPGKSGESFRLFRSPP